MSHFHNFERLQSLLAPLILLIHATMGEPTVLRAIRFLFRELRTFRSRNDSHIVRVSWGERIGCTPRLLLWIGCRSPLKMKLSPLLMTGLHSCRILRL